MHLRIVAAAHGLCGLWEVLGVQVDDCMAGAEVADNAREGNNWHSSARDDDTCAIGPSRRPLRMQACQPQLLPHPWLSSTGVQWIGAKTARQLRLDA